MNEAGSSPHRPRLAEALEVGQALAAALGGGPPVAPLPTDRAERVAALAMLRPDLPVTEPHAAAIVSTSGSTGRPKGVVLSRPAIVAAVAATHERLGGPGDWVLALPAHYVAGLMVLARGLIAGTEVGVARSDLTDLPAVVARLASRRYLSLVPTQLARGLALPAVAAALASFDAVLLGGGPVDPSLLIRATDAGVRAIPTYGMSETAGGCVYDGRPLTGVGIDLDGRGRILMSGPSLFSGYRLRPDLTAATLADGRLRTQDRGRWRTGRLEVLGRLDEVVITGGLKVDLAEVERLARPWPGLAGAELAVVGVPDAEWGIRIVAVTDGRPRDPETAVAQLRTFLTRSLPAYAAPRELVQVAALPRTGSGKLDRAALRSQLEAAPR